MDTFSPCPRCDGYNDNCAGCELQAYHASGLTPADLPRAAELYKADLEGRCAESPYPDGDHNIIACPRCGSGEYLANEDGADNDYCGQCGQKIDWRPRR